MGTATFPARQAEPGQRFSHTDDEFGDVELVADDEGVVRPETIAEHRLMESFRVPLADGHEPYAGPLYGRLPDPEEDEADEPEHAGPTREVLRARARELGIPVSGSKAELEERIAAAEAANRTGGDA